MENIFLKTDRLILRQMRLSDFEELSPILKDPEVMYAWEYDFSDTDVLEWIKRNIELYERYGLGYFLALNKKTGEVVGQLALMPDEIDGEKFYEVGYILKKSQWKSGYAKEGARALLEYAFNVLQQPFVVFEIRPENINSRKVAESLGAKIVGDFVKEVRGKKMLHLIYKLFMLK